jgi:hypothetical protein
VPVGTLGNAWACEDHLQREKCPRAYARGIRDTLGTLFVHYSVRYIVQGSDVASMLGACRSLAKSSPLSTGLCGLA